MDLTFGGALTAWMKKNGETQYTLAERCDVTPSAVRKWEADNRMCQKNIKKIKALTGMAKDDPSTWVIKADDAQKKDPLRIKTVELDGVYMTEGDCPDCYMSMASCATLKDILGVKCGNQNGLIFVRESEEQWEPCTDKNVKIGSTVRHLFHEKDVYEVDHIINEKLFLLRSVNKYKVYGMINFEVKVVGG